MTPLLLLLAATPPSPPSSAYVEIRQNEVKKGSARIINCSGSGITCAVNVTTNEATFFVDGGGGGGAPTNASYITEVAEAGLSNEFAMASLGTGLVKNTTGTGVPSIYAGSSCGAGQYANATSASGALTCATPAGTPGGSSPQVQYNNSGAFGGIANVESDGTHLRGLGETAAPAAPTGQKTALHFDYQWDAGFPSMPTTIDDFMGLPIPAGLFATFMPGTVGGHGWICQCWQGQGWGNGTFINTMNAVGATASGSTASNTWASTDFATRLRWVQLTTSSANTLMGERQAAQSVWRGNTAGAGGWLSWQRFIYEKQDAGYKTAVGLFNKQTALSGSSDPNVELNCVYLGANQGDANLSICSNDNSGTATCSTLGSNFPANNLNLGYITYDLYLSAAPNGSVINYRVDKLDSSGSISQTTANAVSTDLPQNTVQMGWHTTTATGAGQANGSLGVADTCVCANP